MPIKKSINSILKMFAVLLLVVIALPNAGLCAAKNASTTIAMSTQSAHSCCAAESTVCTTAQMSNDCCCKSTPVERAATPGLVATPSSQFTHVAVLPPIPLPASFQAQQAVWRDSVVAHAPPPKLYIFYRSLLI